MRRGEWDKLVKAPESELMEQQPDLLKAPESELMEQQPDFEKRSFAPHPTHFKKKESIMHEEYLISYFIDKCESLNPIESYQWNSVFSSALC